MQISRSPLRVSFIGGGTDIPWYFEKYGGCVLSMAIDKHIYISGRPMFENDSYLLKYSKLENVKSLEDIEHPIIREVMRYFKIKSMDIGVSSDFPAGTGMGSSSTFTVGLIQLASNFMGKQLTAYEIAELACKIEIEVLGEPIGKQDQFSSAFGGFNFIKFEKSGEVEVKSVSLDSSSLEWLNSSLHIVPIGKSRSASKILHSQAKKAAEDKVILNGLHALRELAEDSFAKVSISPDHLSEVLNQSWRLKIQSNPEVTNETIDQLIALGLDNGAKGAKLLGAGGSGFVLFIVPKDKLGTFKEVLGTKSFRVIPIQLDQSGSTILYDSEGKL
jgi:D-glycero-alpha-D-manno-heptose-7-phosphate kinase